MKFNLSKIALVLLASSLATVTFAKGGYKDAGFKDAPCPTPPSLMDGFYVGAQAGYDAYRVRSSVSDASGSFSDVNSLTGWVGGLFAGYGQYFSNNFYLGGELLGNYNGSDQTITSGTDNDGDTFSRKLEVKETWGLALLPGMKLNDTTLGYFRLGYDWTKFDFNTSATDGATATTVSGSNNSREGGWDFGLGLETLVYQNWSVRTEYNHVWYGSFNAGGASIDPSDNQFMLGVLYHFA
jgi:outer membrane autotransporter protein